MRTTPTMRSTGRYALVALSLLFSNGCLEDLDQDGVVRIACLGDSNTLPFGAPAPPPAFQGWCTKTAALLPQVVVPGPNGEAVWRPTSFFSVAQGTAGAIDTGSTVNDGPEQVALALVFLDPDVLVLSFGSADLLRGQTPTDIKNALLAMQAQAGGVRVYVALVPPLYEPICVEGLGPCEGCTGDVDNYCQSIDPLQFNEKVDELNALLVASFPAGRTIDFHSIVTSQPLGTEGDYADPVHFTEAAQAKRAAKAKQALFLGY